MQVKESHAHLLLVCETIDELTFGSPGAGGMNSSMMEASTM
jgi:hypothetical protein